MARKSRPAPGYRVSGHRGGTVHHSRWGSAWECYLYCINYWLWHDRAPHLKPSMTYSNMTVHDGLTYGQEEWEDDELVEVNDSWEEEKRIHERLTVTYRRLTKDSKKGGGHA